MIKTTAFAAMTALAFLLVSPVAVAKKEPAKPNTIEVPAPAEGMAKVVFFRPKKFVGGGVNFKVRENDVELGRLRNGNYFMIDVSPGKHTYTVHSEAKDHLNLELDAGETFFVKGSVTMGVLVGRPNLSPSSEAEFRAEAKLKPAKPLKK